VESTQRAILFADVADSSGLYQSLGDAQALQRINALFARLGAAVARHGGSVVKTLGDAMVCAFGDPDGAFRAACEMHELAAAEAAADAAAPRIKTGFTHGPVVLASGDVFGDTVNVSAKLAELARPDQALTTQQSVEALSPGLRTRCRPLFPYRVKGRPGEVVVCDVMWRLDPDVTETNLARAYLAQAADAALKLTYEGDTFVVNRAQPSLRLGRDKENEVVVASLFASRQHARVYWRDGHFVLADQSTNGTFLMGDGDRGELLLRREEAILGERGWIGLGKSAARHGDHTVRYRIERGPA